MPVLLAPLSASSDLVDRVYEALLDAICSGRWAPGDRLTQEQAAQHLGVSRQPVLQAMRVLERQGLVLASPNRKGVRIAPLDPVFLSQLYAVRGALDALAARLSARLPRPELREPGAALLRTGRAALAAGDLAALVDADLAFHRFVYEASGNALLLQTATVHWHHTRRAMAAFLRLPAPLAHVWDEHEGMLDAVVAGDAEMAAQRSQRHADAAAAALLRRLSANADARVA